MDSKYRAGPVFRHWCPLVIWTLHPTSMLMMVSAQMSCKMLFLKLSRLKLFNDLYCNNGTLSEGWTDFLFEWFQFVFIPQIVRKTHGTCLENIHTYIYIYIHTCMHLSTYMYTYIHTYENGCKLSSSLKWKSFVSDVLLFIQMLLSLITWWGPYWPCLCVHSLNNQLWSTVSEYSMTHSHRHTKQSTAQHICIALGYSVWMLSKQFITFISTKKLDEIIF